MPTRSTAAGISPTAQSAVAQGGTRVHEPRPEERLVDSVAQLTLHRDIDALDHSLTLSLSELLGARRVLLYKCMGEEYRLESLVCCQRVPSGHYEVRPPAAAESEIWYPRLRACMERADCGCEEDPGNGFLLWTPIRRDGISVGVIMVETDASSEGKESVLDGFCRIYSNYVSLIREAERDRLTGLLNRGTLDGHIQRMLARSMQDRASGVTSGVWLAILDIDHFKRVNDTYGHLYGDEVILWVAQKLKACFRPPNALFRFGGEEFVAVLTATDPAQVQAMLEAFRQQTADHVFSQIGTVTVSIGMVAVSSDGYSTKALDLADKALYYAKNHGRNQVRNYHQLVADGLLDAEVMVGSVDLF